MLNMPNLFTIKYITLVIPLLHNVLTFKGLCWSFFWWTGTHELVDIHVSCMNSECFVLLCFMRFINFCVESHCASWTLIVSFVLDGLSLAVSLAFGSVECTKSNLACQLKQKKWRYYKQQIIKQTNNKNNNNTISLLQAITLVIKFHQHLCSPGIYSPLLDHRTLYMMDTIISCDGLKS